MLEEIKSNKSKSNFKKTAIYVNRKSKACLREQSSGINVILNRKSLFCSKFICKSHLVKKRPDPLNLEKLI